MELTEQEIIHKSERGIVTLKSDENGNEYICKTGKFNPDVIAKIANINSPHIAHIVSYSENEIVMERIYGKQLSELNVPPKQLYDVICEICDGLAALHSAGIIHRDIKPSNIMLTDEGHVKIIDFDAARIKKPEADKDTSFIGTDGFAPPEQFGFMQTDERSDIYALGVTIKLLLKENYESSSLRPVAEKCMRFDPAERYSSAGKVKSAIAARRYRALTIACFIVSAAVLCIVSIILILGNKPAEIPVSETTENIIISEPIIVSDSSATTTFTMPETISSAETVTSASTKITTVSTAEKTDNTVTETTTETASETVSQSYEPTTEQAITEAELPEITFLPEGFPTPPSGITEINDKEHVKSLVWEKLDKNAAYEFIDQITDWFGDSAKFYDKDTRMGRTIQWRRENSESFNGYVGVLYVDDTEKYSAFPQFRFTISEIEEFEEVY